MVTEECSGLCSPGYYCPEGSISPEEVMCGEPSRYCEGGNYRPVVVPEGYFSIGGNESTRHGISQAKKGYFASLGVLYVCPAGRYGLRNGESSSLCSGVCQRGFFCPPGSVSPLMHPCGSDNLICPTGSAVPVKVRTGFYTTSQWEEGCKPGNIHLLYSLVRA